jgi:thiol-disulfide isomerase/thioredoxin
MKKRLFALLLPALLLGAALVSCNSPAKEQKEETPQAQTLDPAANDGIVRVIYFHGARRCPTCVTVQEVAKETVETIYADNPKVAFVEVDIDKAENAALAEKYEIFGSSLLITCNEKFENITGVGFQNARSRPEVFREKIKEIVDTYL